MTSIDFGARIGIALAVAVLAVAPCPVLLVRAPTRAAVSQGAGVKVPPVKRILE